MGDSLADRKGISFRFLLFCRPVSFSISGLCPFFAPTHLVIHANNPKAKMPQMVLRELLKNRPLLEFAGWSPWGHVCTLGMFITFLPFHTQSKDFGAPYWQMSMLASPRIFNALYATCTFWISEDEFGVEGTSCSCYPAIRYTCNIQLWDSHEIDSFCPVCH